MTPVPIPLTAAELLEREFLGIRGRLLKVAAALDRIDRAGQTPVGDGRLEAIRRALEVLSRNAPGRAEALQHVFSLPYEENWRQQFGL